MSAEAERTGTGWGSREGWLEKSQERWDLVSSVTGEEAGARGGIRTRRGLTQEMD